ncbi:MAG: cytochrome c oxidase subunit II [Vulcanimicrobiaceae bacterium]
MHIHRYERLWIWIGVATLGVFFVLLAYLGVSAGLAPPGHNWPIDPTKVYSTPPFDHPGLRRRADGSYDAYYVAQVFSWNPSTITIPVGAKVTFYVTSADVVHGFSIPDKDVNLEIMPGWVNSATHTFRTPGTFLIVCNQYCGIGHQGMFGKIIVK